MQLLMLFFPKPITFQTLIWENLVYTKILSNFMSPSLALDTKNKICRKRINTFMSFSSLQFYGMRNKDLKKRKNRGTWVAQVVKSPISAEGMISQFVSSIPTSGSVLTAQSLGLASDSVSHSLCPSPTPVLSQSLKNKINVKKFKKINKRKNIRTTLYPLPTEIDILPDKFI